MQSRLARAAFGFVLMVSMGTTPLPAQVLGQDDGGPRGGPLAPLPRNAPGGLAAPPTRMGIAQLESPDQLEANKLRVLMAALARSADRVAWEPDRPIQDILTELLEDEIANALPGAGGQGAGGPRPPREIAERLLLATEIARAWFSLVSKEVEAAGTGPGAATWLAFAAGPAEPFAAGIAGRAAADSLLERSTIPFTGAGGRGLWLPEFGFRQVQSVPIPERLVEANRRYRAYWPILARIAMDVGFHSLHQRASGPSGPSGTAAGS